MEQLRKADRLLLGVILDTLRCGLSGILTKESFTIRQILLVGQERPSEEGW